MTPQEKISQARKRDIERAFRSVTPPAQPLLKTPPAEPQPNITVAKTLAMIATPATVVETETTPPPPQVEPVSEFKQELAVCTSLSAAGAESYVSPTSVPPVLTLVASCDPQNASAGELAAADEAVAEITDGQQEPGDNIERMLDEDEAADGEADGEDEMTYDGTPYFQDGITFGEIIFFRRLCAEHPDFACGIPIPEGLKFQLTESGVKDILFADDADWVTIVNRIDNVIREVNPNMTILFEANDPRVLAEPDNYVAIASNTDGKFLGMLLVSDIEDRDWQVPAPGASLGLVAIMPEEPVAVVEEPTLTDFISTPGNLYAANFTAAEEPQINIDELPEGELVVLEVQDDIAFFASEINEEQPVVHARGMNPAIVHYDDAGFIEVPDEAMPAVTSSEVVAEANEAAPPQPVVAAPKPEAAQPSNTKQNRRDKFSKNKKRR